MKSWGGFPFLTAAEMAETDRFAIETMGMRVESLMENAGARTAELARKLLGGKTPGSRVVVLVGRGNNGGDGLVAARHLYNWGAAVKVVLGEARSDLREAPGEQLRTIEAMGVPVGGSEDRLVGADLLVDALLGYGSKGDPREPMASVISRANSSGVPTIAVDVPSGLDATTGRPGAPCISARATIAFGFPKAGFLEPGARRFIGELHVADISLPRAAYSKHSATGMFSSGPLVRVW